MEQVRTLAASGGGRLSGADLAQAVRASGLVVGSGSAARVIRLLQEDLRGLGPLQELADVPGTTDVLVDGTGRVWTDGGQGLREEDLRFGDPQDVRRLAVRLAASAGTRLDDGRPFADVVLGPYRIHAVLPPVSTAGPLVSVRIRRPVPPDLEDVLPGGAASPWLAPLRALVRARLNFLVSGGTGAGKTTLLGSLLATADPGERIVVVEDDHELDPRHPHVVGLQSRTANVEGAGAIGMSELVRQALRMRPDRLVVGECRGAEVRDFLAAMNTGHDGAGGTVHASSAAAVPARLAAMGALAGLSPEAVAVQAASALDAVVHVARGRDGRGPVELARVRAAGTGLAVDTVLRARPGGLEPGPGLAAFEGDLAERGSAWSWR